MAIRCGRIVALASSAMLLTMICGGCLAASCHGPSESVSGPSHTATGDTSARLLAYVVDGDVWIMGLDATMPRQLSWSGDCDSPAFSPSGRFIAFACAQEVRLAPIDGQARSVGRQPCHWAPDSDKLAFVTGDGNIAVLDAASDESRTVVPARQGELVRDFLDVVWSPDEKRIAFTSTTGNSSRITSLTTRTPILPTKSCLGIRSVDGDSSEQAQSDCVYGDSLARLAAWPRNDLGPLAWVGTGLGAGQFAGALPLSLIADNGNVVTLAPRVLYSPESVAGEELPVVASLGGRRETWMDKSIAMLWADRSPRVLTEPDESALHPALSPSRASVAFSAATNEPETVGGPPARDALSKRKIFVIGVDGSNRRQLADDPNYRDEASRWWGSDDSLLIGRIDNNTLNKEIWFAPTLAGQLQRLATNIGSPRVRGGTMGDWFGYYGLVDWSALFSAYP